MSAKPTFGQRFTNTVASIDNPRKVGMYVRTVHTPHGRMNPGTFYELTDGAGDFWETPVHRLESVEGVLPSAAGVEAATTALIRNDTGTEEEVVRRILTAYLRTVLAEPSTRTMVADMLAENDAAGVGPLSREEYLADADALIQRAFGESS